MSTKDVNNHRMTRPTSSKGFAPLAALLLLVIVFAIVGVGWVVYHHSTNHETKSTSTSTTQKSGQSATKTAVNPYAGWKEYCDFYSYCFKYPSTWTLTVATAPTEACAAGQVNIDSPDKQADLLYQNDNNSDGGASPITPVSINAMASGDSTMKVVGNYQPVGIHYLPEYDVLDSSTITADSLAVGQTGEISEPALFTDLGPGLSTPCGGTFRASPVSQSQTAADAEAWFSTENAKTSLLILQSFYYKH